MKNIDKIRGMTPTELAKLFQERSCDVCAFKLYDECHSECVDGITIWLNKEYELTLEDIENETDEYCVGECQYCKYKGVNNCRLSFIVDHFNIINGKIERRNQDV